MRELELDDKKKLSFDMLCCLDDFCKSNGIKYYLAYGTLLGSVRHQGFIPWDDDIDVIMFRDDYNKFINIFKDNEQVACLSFENNKFGLPYTKLVYKHSYIMAMNRIDSDSLKYGIDIFPFDYVKYKKFRRGSIIAYFLNKLNRYNLYNSRKELGGVNFGRRMFYCFSKVFTRRFCNKMLKTACRLYTCKSSNYCRFFYDPKNQLVFDINDFDKEMFGIFNGRKFPIPCGYDDFLSKYYGNYLQLPPEENRVGHSTEKAFWIDE